MSTVYGCSSLNIAASKAKDRSMGLFSSRDPRSIENLQNCLRYRRETRDRMSDGSEENIAEQRTSDDYCQGILFDCAPQGFYTDCVAESPLGKRTWVLQERILSPKTLYFSNKLLWSCETEDACETFPSHIPGIFYPKSQDLRTTDNSEHWMALV